MTSTPFTAEQILAAFSNGSDSSRINAMAQEIAGLANENAALKREIADLQSRPIPTVADLANEEAARILDEARAQTFAEANKTWIEGHERWREAHDLGTFIPAPISAAAIDLSEALSQIGEFWPVDRRLRLFGDAHEAAISVGKKETVDSYTQLLSQPANGESVTKTMQVKLVAARTSNESEASFTKLVFAYADGMLLGGLTPSFSVSYVPFLDAMHAMGIDVYANAQLTLTASAAKGALSNKGLVGLPDRFEMRDTLPQIRRIAKALTSAYATNTAIDQGTEAWLNGFGMIMAETREEEAQARELAKERRLMMGR